MSTKLKSWIAGIALAIIGIVIAKVLASMFEPSWLQLAMYFVGVILAIAGLGVILYGMRSKG